MSKDRLPAEFFTIDFPESAADALAAWDRGEVLWSVEMGGLGPAYEQCIQILVFEMIRGALKRGRPASITDFGLVAASVASNLDSVYHFSGAQVAVARSLAWNFCNRGYRASMADPAVLDRMIQVTRKMPEAPPLEGVPA